MEGDTRIATNGSSVSLQFPGREPYIFHDRATYERFVIDAWAALQVWRTKS